MSNKVLIFKDAFFEVNNKSDHKINISSEKEYDVVNTLIPTKRWMEQNKHQVKCPSLFVIYKIIDDDGLHQSFGSSNEDYFDVIDKHVDKQEE